MRPHHDDTAVTTATRIIPPPTGPLDAHLIGEHKSCLSMPSGPSSNSLTMAATTAANPVGTPPRKKWEGAFNKFLRGKSPEHSPTLSSSPSTTASNIITEDMSTGTAASGSSSVGGGLKGTKKKSSFSLIPGSKRLVSRDASVKKGMFAKVGSSHKSMDALDVPLRKGSERSRSNGSAGSNPASPSSWDLRKRSSITSQPATSAIRGIGSHSDHERMDSKATRIVSATLPTARSSLDDQLRACSISSIPSYVHQYPSNPQLERTHSGDWHINPIATQGADFPVTMSSSPSLTQLQPQRSQSRTFVYSSNSNSNTPIYQYKQQQELDLGMVPALPTLKGFSSKNRTTSFESHDVGLNLDDSENCNLDDNQSSRSRQSYNSSNTGTIITDPGVSEPPDTLDEILGGIGGLVTVHSSSSSHLLSKMEQQAPASPSTKKAFTKIHNSSEYGQDISPFLGGKHASNVDLASAYKSCITTQQSMLLRSMNSSHSIQSGMRTQFGSIPHTSTMMAAAEGSHNSPPTFLSKSLPTLDDYSMSNNARLLKPIQSADVWAQGRRYLIAPAALAASPLSTIKSLTGSCTQTAKEAARSTDPPNASGAIELGDAFMTYIGEKYHLSCGKWSACKLVLRQNYLFEYNLSSASNSLPRGIVHLQHAVAYTQHDFDDALELHFYASPCAKADLRILLIRVKNKEERDDWITCLNKAARLQISDIWDYKKDCPLGKGRYASIFPARRKMVKTFNDAGEEHQSDQERSPGGDGGNHCALKIIDKSEFWRLVVKGRERCDTIVRELVVQSTLTAKFGTKPTFLQIRGFFETSENIVIELELLDGKDLFEYISSKIVLEEEEAGLIIRDVLIALQSMSRAGIAHRDIKPANILMVKCDESKFGTSVKVADFGMSTLVGVDGFIKGRCGSPGYVAPEILKAKAGEGYRNHVDMFSAGVTLYLMLCGCEPFYGKTEKELIKSNKMANVDFSESEWSKISPEAKDLVVQMLKMDPKDRISAGDALKHPWMVRLSQEQKDHFESRPETNDSTSCDAEIKHNVCSIM